MYKPYIFLAIVTQCSDLGSLLVHLHKYEVPSMHITTMAILKYELITPWKLKIQEKCSSMLLD